MSHTLREDATSADHLDRQGPPDVTLRESGTTARWPGASTRVNLLPCLRDRYVAVRDLDPGGESDVLLVQDSLGVHWVVKQYRAAGWRPADEVLEVFADLRVDRDQQAWVNDPRTRNLVWLAECGQDPSSQLFYEVQEYFPLGSLAGSGQSQLGIGSWPVTDLIDSLVACVAGFHSTVGGAHRDIKPANILVRSTDPLILVLADVGLARQVGELSARMSHRDGSAAYQAPEAAQGQVSRAGDWWAVGMMIAQAALGRHPLARPDGSLPDNQQLLAQVAQRDVPLDDIADPRVNLLCRGLLTRDSAQRWGVAQIRDWQAGRPPQVLDAEPTVPVRSRTVLFSGVDHATPAALAAAFAAEPQRAGETLFTRKDATTIEDLRLLLAAHRLDAAVSMLAQYRSGAWQPTLLRLLAEMDPQLEPKLAGVEVTPEGISGIALSGVQGEALTPSQALALEWVARFDLWPLWRRLPGMAEAAACADRLSSATQHLDPVAITEPYAPGKLVWEPGADPRWLSGQQPNGSYVLVSELESAQMKASRQQFLMCWVLFGATNPEQFQQVLCAALVAATAAAPEACAAQWWRQPASRSTVAAQLAALVLLPAAIAAIPALAQAQQEEQTRIARVYEAELAAEDSRRRHIRREEIRQATAAESSVRYWQLQRLCKDRLALAAFALVPVFGVSVLLFFEPLAFVLRASIPPNLALQLLLGLACLELLLLLLRRSRAVVRRQARAVASVVLASYLAVVVAADQWLFQFYYPKYTRRRKGGAEAFFSSVDGQAALRFVCCVFAAAWIGIFAVWLVRRMRQQTLEEMQRKPAVFDDPAYVWSGEAGDWVPRASGSQGGSEQ